MSVTQCFVEFLTKKVLCEEIVAEGVTEFGAFESESFFLKKIDKAFD